MAMRFTSIDPADADTIARFVKFSSDANRVAVLAQ